MNRAISMLGRGRPTYSNLIGFDELFDALTLSTKSSTSYPPYNLIKVDEDEYTISLAVAGFSREDISISVEHDTLYIEGAKNEDKDEKTYIHKGIGTRNFRHAWSLREHLKVMDATMEDGLLHVSLKRIVPEEMKPRLIEIK